MCCLSYPSPAPNFNVFMSQIASPRRHSSSGAISAHGEEVWPHAEWSKLPTLGLELLELQTICIIHGKQAFPQNPSCQQQWWSINCTGLHSLLGLLLICITMRKLLPLPHEQRGFKHLPSGENRWFISLAGRKDWHMLNILYPGLWSYKASSVGKDHSEENAFLCSPFPPVGTIWSFPGCKQSCLCAAGKGCSNMGHVQLKPATERMAGAWLNLI